MLTISEYELLKKIIRDSIHEDIEYAGGMYILGDSTGITHFCEMIGLAHEDEKWCPGFLKCFREEKEKPFQFKCPVGIIHYFVPLRCFNKHITNVCVASRRVGENPDLDWLRKKTGKNVFRREQDKEHFYSIPTLEEKDKDVIRQKQDRVLKALDRAASQGVGSSVFLKEVFYDIATKSTDLNNLLKSIMDNSIIISNAHQGCLSLEYDETLKRIITCPKSSQDRLCSVHHYSEFFREVTDRRQPLSLPRDYPDLAMEEEARSSLSVPLVIDEAGIGLIHVTSRNNDNFNDIHIERLLDLAKYAATAIKNAKSIEERQPDA